MHGLPEQRSEVAHLLAQIRSEYEAAHQGLSGLAQGSSQHQFITKRMERIGELHAQLHEILGDEAMALIAVQLDHAKPGETEEEEALDKSKQELVRRQEP